MPRYITPPPPKSQELQQAEQDAAKALAAYFRRDFGIQAQMARDTGLGAAVLSKMSKMRGPISMEQAILMDLASNGELAAEMLCPSRAKVISQFLLTRAAKLGA
jgi:DNA-binding transcriptional regulator YdaS (Cro superfamily)